MWNDPIFILCLSIFTIFVVGYAFWPVRPGTTTNKNIEANDGS